MAEAARVLPPELLEAMQTDDAQFAKNHGAETPPKKPPTRPAAAPRRTKKAQDLEILEQKLVERFTEMSMMISLLNPFDGAVIASNAPRLAAAYTKLAAENPSIKRALEQSMEVSAWGEAILATAMVAMPIAKNHGVSLRIPGRKNERDAEPEVPEYLDGNGNGNPHGI